MHIRICKLLLAACLLISILGCSGGLGSSEPQRVTSAPATAFEARNGYRKPGAALQLEAEPVRAQAAGVAVEVTLELIANSRFEQVDLELVGSSALQLLSSSRLALGAMAAGERRAVTASVIPNHGGRVYLAVNATAVQSGQPSGRAFAVPIDVPGTAPRQKALNVQQMPDGERVISLPAQ